MLDSAGYLSSFGWQGKGNGLRQGSLSRPLSIPQKRTLAGLGKDRDEAYPFWDHLFAAAAKSIKVNISGDDDDTDTAAHDDTIPSDSPLPRTATGILSNRRPVAGTPATSGSATPNETDSHPLPRLSLMAMAKRESARRTLYARFFRGPVLGSELDPYDIAQPNSNICSQAKVVVVTNHAEHVDDKKRNHERGDLETSVKKSKRTKEIRQSDTCSTMAVVKERRKKRSSSEERTRDSEEEMSQSSSQQEGTEAPEEKRLRRAAKLEKRKRKEERRQRRAVKLEKRKRREERRQRRAVKLEKRQRKEERRQRKATNLEGRTPKERRTSPEDTHD